MAKRKISEKPTQKEGKSVHQIKKKRVRTDGEVVCWDVTIWKDVDPATICKDLRALAKKWVFQKEESKEKKKHYQVRLALFHKKSLGGTRDLFKDTSLEGAHLSKTSGVNSKNFNYVMKKDSRIEGPWKDNDPDPEEVDEEVFWPELPWQAECIEYIKGPIDKRKIRVYLDRKGGIGKSVLIAKLRYNKLATIIPPTMEKAEDMSAMMMCKPKDRCYVVDLPRSANPKKMANFWAGLEVMKQGYCSDKRNFFRDRLQKKPHIIVFANSTPPMEAMTSDR